MKIYHSNDLPDELCQNIEEIAQYILEILENVNPGLAVGAIQLCLNAYIRICPEDIRKEIIDSIYLSMKNTMEMNTTTEKTDD